MRWIIAGLIAIGLLSGCTSTGDQGQMSEQSMGMPSGEMAMDSSPAQQQVIVTGSIGLKVSEPRESGELVKVLAAESEGRVESETLSSDGSTVTKYMTVRIPAASFESFYTDVIALGEVTEQSVTRSDVTTQVLDLDAQIAALEPSVARLKELLGEATTIADVIAAESALAERQARLDGLLAQREYLQNQVSMSTVYITLTNAGGSGTTVALFFGGALIGAILAGLIAIVLWQVRRR